MTSPEPWEELVAAENAYLAKRMALFAAGPEHQLRLALGAPRGVGTALRALLDGPIELCMSLIDALFRVAVTTHSQVGVARHVIARIDPGWLRVSLEPLVDSLLDRPGASWEDFRRTAELLAELGQRDLLDEVVRRADQSSDGDIREVGDDFRTH